MARYSEPQLRDRRVSSAVLMALTMGYSAKVGQWLCGGYVAFGGEHTKNYVAVYEPSSPPRRAYEYSMTFNQPNLQVSVSVTYGFRFTETKPFVFYKKLLRERTKSERAVVEALYKEGKIPKQVYFKEYLRLMPSQLSRLKRMYRKKEDKPAEMLAFTGQVVDEALSYYKQLIASARN